MTNPQTPVLQKKQRSNGKAIDDQQENGRSQKKKLQHTCIAYSPLMGLPKDFLSRAYFAAQSKLAAAMPSACSDEAVRDVKTRL